MGDGRVVPVSSGFPAVRLVSVPSDSNMIRFSAPSPQVQVVRTMGNMVISQGHPPQYVFVNNGGVVPRPMQPMLQPRLMVQSQAPQQQASQIDESTKKCASFLSVLQRLSRENRGSDETRPQRVTQIIQEVIEERITTEQFVLKLKEALGSQTNSDQLQTFLNQHLPNYRRAVQLGLVTLEGVRPSHPQPAQIQQIQSQPRQQFMQQNSSQQQQVTVHIQPTPQRPPAPVAPKPNKSVIPDEELNDVTTLCGVNLKAESSLPMAPHMASTAQQPERPLLSTNLLRRRVLDCAHRIGLPDAADSALRLLSEAALLRLRQVLERAALAADHRSDTPSSHLYSAGIEPRRQLGFLAEVDRAERQRKDEAERQRLLRAAKSRANDPEQQRLREKAKVMQAMEQEADKVAKSNETAERAIFGRNHKRRTTFGSSSVTPGNSSEVSGASSAKRPRCTRVTARDLAFALERDETAPRRLLQKALT